LPPILAVQANVGALKGRGVLAIGKLEAFLNMGFLVNVAADIQLTSGKCPGSESGSHRCGNCGLQYGLHGRLHFAVLTLRCVEAVFAKCPGVQEPRKTKSGSPIWESFGFKGLAIWLCP